MGRLKSAAGSLAVARRIRLLTAVLAVGSVLLVSARAEAFRTGANSPDLKGTPRVRWNADTISFQVFNAAPPGLELADVTDVLLEAVRTWGKPACSAVHFDMQGITSGHATPGDGVNTIEWLPSGWADHGFKADAAGITDVQYAKMPGGEWAIVEADMYLNGSGHAWVLRDDGAPDTRDVLSVVTHEAGHMLGLLHPCEAGGADGAPDCKSNASFTVTTMYPFYMPTQAVLSADDQAGVCFLYPPDGCADVKCKAGTQCVDGTCMAACGGLVCAQDEVCNNDRCEPLAPPCENAACDAGISSCISKADCASALLCVNGQCQAAAGEAGDPCASATDCAAQACGTDGYCVGQCAPGDCDGGTCNASAGPSDCSQKFPLGAECKEANDCIGAECLAGTEKSAVCTRACGGEHAACPLGWQCSSVQGRSVCAPPAPSHGNSCSCSTAGSMRASAAGSALVVLALGSALGRRRRRRPLKSKVRSVRRQSARSINGVTS